MGKSSKKAAAAVAAAPAAVPKGKKREAEDEIEKAVSAKTEKARPDVEEAAKRAGEAVESGTFAVGKQLGKASGMFAAFKEEFEKAAREDGDD